MLVVLMQLMVAKLNDSILAVRTGEASRRTVTFGLSPYFVSKLIAENLKVLIEAVFTSMQFFSNLADRLVFMCAGQSDSAELKRMFHRQAAKCKKETGQPLDAVNILAVYHSGGNVSVTCSASVHCTYAFTGVDFKNVSAFILNVDVHHVTALPFSAVVPQHYTFAVFNGVTGQATAYDPFVVRDDSNGGVQRPAILPGRANCLEHPDVVPLPYQGVRHVALDKMLDVLCR